MQDMLRNTCFYHQHTFKLLQVNTNIKLENDNQDVTYFFSFLGSLFENTQRMRYSTLNEVKLCNKVTFLPYMVDIT